MIQSMTGYGKAEHKYGDKRLVAEIKSLNSKQLDLSMRMHPMFRSYELQIRNYISKHLERGKVDFSLGLEDISGAECQSFTPINRAAYQFHVQEISELCPELTAAERATLVLRMPDVIKVGETESLEAEQWPMVQDVIDESLAQFEAFRIQEGAALETMFTQKLDAIADLLTQVEPYEKSRIERIRQHLLSGLDKLAEETRTKIDSNRLEQEMIFYLEKLDITEEKVRLTNHIKYFRETMAGSSKGQEQVAGVGKKLGFIAQEMGREINTLGSKSNQSEMQIIVVKMKDLLEQIKEQVLNVL